MLGFDNGPFEPQGCFEPHDSRFHFADSAFPSSPRAPHSSAFQAVSAVVFACFRSGFSGAVYHSGASSGTPASVQSAQMPLLSVLANALFSCPSFWYGRLHSRQEIPPVLPVTQWPRRRAASFLQSSFPHQTKLNCPPAWHSWPHFCCVHQQGALFLVPIPEADRGRERSKNQQTLEPVWALGMEPLQICLDGKEESMCWMESICFNGGRPSSAIAYTTLNLRSNHSR